MATIAVERAEHGRAAGARAADTAVGTPILTRAETAECTCPEPCERDHEND